MFGRGHQWSGSSVAGRIGCSGLAGQGDAAASRLRVEHRPDGRRVAVDLFGKGLEHGVVGAADQLTVLGGDAVEGAVAEPDGAVGIVVGFVAASGQCPAERGKDLVRSPSGAVRLAASAPRAAAAR